MLPRERRVPRELLIQSPGKRVSFAFGSLKLVEGGVPQGAVILSKKIAKTAPKRNKIRRRVYAILRDIFDKKLAGGVVVVYPNKESLTTRYQILKEAIEKALQSAR